MHEYASGSSGSGRLQSHIGHRTTSTPVLVPPRVIAISLLSLRSACSCQRQPSSVISQETASNGHQPERVQAHASKPKPLTSAEAPQMKPRSSPQRSPSASRLISPRNDTRTAQHTCAAIYDDAPTMQLLDQLALTHCITLYTSECPVSRCNWLNGPD